MDRSQVGCDSPSLFGRARGTSPLAVLGNRVEKASQTVGFQVRGAPSDRWHVEMVTSDTQGRGVLWYVGMDRATHPRTGDARIRRPIGLVANMPGKRFRAPAGAKRGPAWRGARSARPSERRRLASTHGRHCAHESHLLPFGLSFEAGVPRDTSGCCSPVSGDDEPVGHTMRTDGVTRARGQSVDLAAHEARQPAATPGCRPRGAC
jgi:hypothetical protein